MYIEIGGENRAKKMGFWGGIRQVFFGVVRGLRRVKSLSVKRISDMDQNPYEAPTGGCYDPERRARSSRLASSALMLGAACGVVSVATVILGSPIGFGELIHHIPVWGNIALDVLHWVLVVTALVGPVPAGIAVWQGSGVVRVWGIFLLLIQTPFFLEVVRFLVKSVVRGMQIYM